jgi:hypothetical protein
MIALAPDPCELGAVLAALKTMPPAAGGPPCGRASLDRGCARRPAEPQVGTEKRCPVEQKTVFTAADRET